MMSRIKARFSMRWLFALVGLMILVLYLITFPPSSPSYRRTVAAWQPSEAWLYDRNGQLLDSQQIGRAHV